MIFKKKDRFILAKDFCKIHNESYQCLIQSENRSKFLEKRCEDLYINETFVLRERKEYSVLWNKCHDNYFELAEVFPDYRIAKMWISYTNRDLSLSMAVNYLAKGLFSVAWMDKSLMNCKRSALLQDFYEFSEYTLKDHE